MEVWLPTCDHHRTYDGWSVKRFKCLAQRMQRRTQMGQDLNCQPFASWTDQLPSEPQSSFIVWQHLFLLWCISADVLTVSVCLYVCLFIQWVGGASLWVCGTRTPRWGTSWAPSLPASLFHLLGECLSSCPESSLPPAGSCASSSWLKVSS